MIVEDELKMVVEEEDGIDDYGDDLVDLYGNKVNAVNVVNALNPTEDKKEK